MKKFAQLTFLIIFAAFIAFSCDSVTNPDIDQRSGSANLTMGSGQGTEGEHENSADIIDVDEDSFAENWGVVKETGESGNIEFTNGPDFPINGEGSAKFTLEADEDGVALIGAIFEGSIPLANLETLEYNTYQPDGSESPTVSLQFNVNYENDDNDEWQGRLVFEPYYEGTINTGEWQTWDALTQRGWWATGAPGNDLCQISTPCTLEEILDEFPDAEIRSEEEANGAGLIIFKAGSEWGAFEGYVDGFTIDFNDELLTYNFQSSESDDDENGDNGDQDENGDNGDNGDQDENGDNGDNGDNDDQDENGNDTENGENGEEDDNNPTVKEDCKNGGWAEYGFRNQGQCVRYVNTGQDSREEEEEENGDDENGDETDDNDEEQADDPSSIDECKNGGWEAFGFRNQGQCVRYVNTGKDSRGDSDSDDDTDNGNDDNGDDNDEENGDQGNNNDQNGNGNNGDNGSDNNGDNNNDNNGDDQNGDNGDENEDSGVTGDDEEQNDPETADDCRQGGWQEFGFKNQGQCIQFVNTGRDNR